MIGSITLGCLLGQYDKAQSFDVNSIAGPLFDGDVGSWNFFVGSGGFTNAPSITHSSGQALSCFVGCRGTGAEFFSYAYAQPNDAYARWFPDITTHALTTDFWANMSVASTSGDFFQDFEGIPGEVDQTIGFDNFLMIHYRNSVLNCTSAEPPKFRLVGRANAGSIRTARLEDVLTQIDPITIHPTWDFRERQELQRFNNKTLGAIQHTYSWDKHFAWSVPLQFLSTSHANLINWWWQNQLNLLFTLNTSDSESMFVTRIVNDQQPINRRIRPHDNLWSGMISLESLIRGA